MTLRPLRAACLALLLMILFAGRAAGAPREAIRRLNSMDSLTVVVTDSGLGGLSVVADAARKLAEQAACRQVDLIFYNALFTGEGGYNSLPDRDDKIRVFDRALRDMQGRFAPDVILVACNTLSVLAPETEFVAAGKTPVIGIVDAGVDLIARPLEADPGAWAIIFATETTAQEGTHAAALGRRGIGPDRLIVQQCPELASYIEKEYDGPETQLLVDAYVGEALARSGARPGPLYVSLNCTHYGYALEAWRNAFLARGVAVAGFLNPNRTMADILLRPDRGDTAVRVDVRVRVVSMVEIPEGTRASLGGLLERESPATARALREYELVPDLFQWRDLPGRRDDR